MDVWQGPGGQGGVLRCPIGLTVTFDWSSDDLYGTTGHLKGPMGSRGMFRGPKGHSYGPRGSYI